MTVNLTVFWMKFGLSQKSCCCINKHSDSNCISPVQLSVCVWDRCFIMSSADDQLCLNISSSLLPSSSQRRKRPTTQQRWARVSILKSDLMWKCSSGLKTSSHIFKSVFNSQVQVTLVQDFHIESSSGEFLRFLWFFRRNRLQRRGGSAPQRTWKDHLSNRGSCSTMIHLRRRCRCRLKLLLFPLQLKTR